MGIFARHAHKDKLAYNTNHDTLMTMSPVNRAKMITYFIAANTRIKLDPEDRTKVTRALDTISRNANLLGLAGFFIGAMATKMYRVNSRYALLAGGFAAYYARFLYMNHAEREFVFESNLISQLALKYKFSIFDFHNSKKEVQICQLAAEILSENPSLLNTYPD
jgi:hypothetical protein